MKPPGWLSKAATLLTVLVASLAISSGCSGRREVIGQVFVVTKGGENVKLGLVGIHVVSREELLLAAEHAVTNSSEFFQHLDITARSGDAEEFWAALPRAGRFTDASGKFQIQARAGDLLLARATVRLGGEDRVFVWAVPAEELEGKPALLSNHNLLGDPSASRQLLSTLPGIAQVAELRRLGERAAKQARDMEAVAAQSESAARVAAAVGVTAGKVADEKHPRLDGARGRVEVIRESLSVIKKAQSKASAFAGSANAPVAAGEAAAAARQAKDAMAKAEMASQNAAEAKDSGAAERSVTIASEAAAIAAKAAQRAEQAATEARNFAEAVAQGQMAQAVAETSQRHSVAAQTSAAEAVDAAQRAILYHQSARDSLASISAIEQVTAAALAAFDYGLQAEVAERKAAEAFTASKPADSLAAAAIASQAAERAATAQRTADDALQRLRQLSKADLPSMLDKADRAQGSAQSADIELGRDLKMLEAATTAAAGLTNGLYVQSIRPALRGLGTNSAILVHLALEQGRRSLATAHAAATASATGRSNVASAMTRSLTPVILALVDSAIAGATLAKSTFVSVLPDGASLDEGERILHRGMKQLRLAEMEMQTIDQLATSVGDETEKPAVDRSRKLVSEARHAVLTAVETLANGIVEAARRSLEEMRKSDAVPAKSAGLEVALEYAAARGHEARRFHEFEDRFEKVLGDRTSDSLAEVRRRLTRIVEEVAAEVGKANLLVRALLREESARLASQAADEASKDGREWNRGQLVEYTARLDRLSERNATLQKLADQHPAMEPLEGSAVSVIRATQKSVDRLLQEGANQIAKLDAETKTKNEAARARFAKVGRFEAGESLVLGIPVRWIPAGRFQMGSPSSEEGRDWDEVQHEVVLSRGFFMGETECTQGQWEAVMGSNPSQFKGGDRPVENVSWEEAAEYCRKLTSRQRGEGILPQGWAWRLPTEAEWEYAARAGTVGARHGQLEGIAWFYGNSGNETHGVKGKQANGWGLHDMIGNVSEWCSNWYGEYPTGVVTDPTGPASGSNRLNRGGSWYNGTKGARSAYRSWDVPGFRDAVLGFRPVLSADR